MSTTTKIPLTGSCKCGFVKYTLKAKVNADGVMNVNRCNCTFCQKLGTTNYYCDGPEDFELLSPASKEELGLYAPRVKTCPRRFCKECGNHVMMDGYYEMPTGGRRDMFVVNIATIDQPQAGVDLNNVNISYYDGLTGSQMKGTQDKPFPGGLV
ncbi:hypothetical protein AMS68_004655 [Peltaster fructicola]|uniref:CENP-V/GFA domain-containing protein n=1 Tax=Peltaster fructicola TaxID=286661 RepID=A0A6H0XX14_9PEZI|nr:hypothetical protein AMS68_004655 [Peltaster fructicola]